MYQVDLFGNNTPQETKRQLKSRKRKEDYNVNGTPRKNPMLKIHGEMPGKKCKTCKSLCYLQFANKYYKCRLRGCSGGPATDHRVNWPACAKYIEE